MIIDIHCHAAFHKTYAKYFVEGVVDGLVDELPKKIKEGLERQIIKNIMMKTLEDLDCQKLIEQMEQSGITKAALLIGDLDYETNDCAFTIEEIHEYYYKIYSDHPDKFVVFSGIDPRRGIRGIELFEKSVKEYGFKGLKLYPPCGFELDDSMAYPLYEICDKYSIPVLTHTGKSVKTMKNTYDYISSIKKLAVRFKKIKFVLAHATYSDFSGNLEVAGIYDNVFLDLSGFQSGLGNQIELNKKIEILFNRIPHKILFGSDWPMYKLLGDQVRWIDYFGKLGFISNEKLDLFFYKNAQLVMGKL